MISERELADLLAAGHATWWSDDGLCLEGGSDVFLPDFKARLLGQTVDLAHAPPICVQTYVSEEYTKKTLTEFVLLTEGWRYAGHFKRWRPLVYFTAFGTEAVFEQLGLSMTTLREFGAYDGEVAVITNRERAYVEQFVPPDFRSQLRIVPVEAVDYIDYCLARYRIVEDRQTLQYSPVLYVDTDIAFDAPIEPLLRKIRSATSLSAAAEPARLSDVDTVGAFLFREAEIDPGDCLGFNAGCLGVPDLGTFQWFYRAVLDVADAYMTCRGRGALWLADQPVTNYLAHLAKAVAPDPITTATRVGDLQTSAAKDQRRGFVHFWLVRGQTAKRDALRSYLEALREGSPAN